MLKNISRAVTKINIHYETCEVNPAERDQRRSGKLRGKIKKNNWKNLKIIKINFHEKHHKTSRKIFQWFPSDPLQEFLHLQIKIFNDKTRESKRVWAEVGGKTRRYFWIGKLLEIALENTSNSNNHIFKFFVLSGEKISINHLKRKSAGTLKVNRIEKARKI